MKKYSNIVISGSLNVTGSLFLNGNSISSYSVSSSNPTLEFRRTRIINFSSGTDQLINWDVTDVNTISSDLAYSSGVFTNQSGVTKTFVVDYQSGVASSANITEVRIYVTLNGTPTITNRIVAQVGTNYGISNALESLSRVVTLAPNDTLRFYTYVTTTGAVNWETSAAVFGYSGGQSTRLKITAIS